MTKPSSSLVRSIPSDGHSRRPDCPACGHKDFAIIAELPLQSPPLSDYLRSFYRSPAREVAETLTGYTCRIAECRRCGTIFHEEVPRTAFLQEFYSALSATESPSGQLHPYREEQRFRELMMVARFLQPRVPQPRVLDFGTGDGTWARLAAAAGCKAEATDTSETAFPMLRACGVVCRPPTELLERHYDLINAEQVFEHLPDPITALTRLTGALRDDGVLKIGVPWDPRLREKLRVPDWLAPKHSSHSLNSVAPIEHLNAFTPAGLEQLGHRAGLSPLVVRGWELLMPDDKSRKWSWRKSLGQTLRRLLNEVHQPPYALAQTRFFVRH